LVLSPLGAGAIDMRAIHIITSLDTGGAQSVLVQILQQLKILGHEQTVISLKPHGEMSLQINDLGIPLHEIPVIPQNIWESRSTCERIISSFQADIIQSWLYHADFLTIFLRNQKQIPIIWGIHHSYGPHGQNRLKASTKGIIRINALFSKIIPQKIICCSRSALRTHSRIGYAESKMVYIPNGIDVKRFKPDENSRINLRSELGLSFETQIIGYIARYHPQKDHTTFFNAANILLGEKENIHFVLAGDQMDAENPEIQRQMLLSKNSSHFHFLGKRTDIPMITAGLDLATLSSSGDEAFPLAIIEAMASGIPCVATEVGDIKEMIGSCGIMVPTQDAKALSEGWLKILSYNQFERGVIGKAARDRVLDNFTSEAMAHRYISVYQLTKGYIENHVDKN
jgi:glycosyltransferase involved in cell wall biosynthesis